MYLLDQYSRRARSEQFHGGEEGCETELKGSARHPSLSVYPLAHFPETGVR